MTLLTSKEILDIAWADSEDMKLAVFAAKMQLKRVTLEEFNLLAERGVRLNNPPEVARAQLAKVIAEIETMYGDNLGLLIDRWLEAARKELEK